MIYKTNPQNVPGQEWLKGFNYLPDNIEEISKEMFWQKFAGPFSAEFSFGKQIFDNGKCVGDYTLWYYHDGTVIGWKNKVEKARTVEPDTFIRAKKCEHDFEYKKLGNCYHSYTCKKCGYHYTEDSSG